MKSLLKFSPVVLLMCLVYLASCTPEPLPQTNTPIQLLDVPPQDYFGVDWFTNGRIVVDLDQQPYELKDNELVSLVLESEPDDCWLVQYRGFSALPDGRLGVLRDCVLEQGGREYKLDLVAFDWQDNSFVTLTPNVGFGTVSWHPDMSRGVQSIGSLNGTIQWLSPEGTQPIDLVINSGDKSWSLATNYYSIQNPQIDANKAGIARSASWSPDGSQIAFFATSDPVNQSGIARAYGEYTLYLMNPDTLEIQAVLDDVYFAHVIEWSPNGEWLAFSGRTGSPRRAGLWLYSPLLDELHPVVFDINVGSHDWSPDGQQIMAVVCDKICDESVEPGQGYQRSIVIYDVSHIVENSVPLEK